MCQHNYCTCTCSVHGHPINANVLFGHNYAKKLYYIVLILPESKYRYLCMTKCMWYGHWTCLPVKYRMFGILSLKYCRQSSFVPTYCSVRDLADSVWLIPG